MNKYSLSHLNRFWQQWGILRSLIIYYGQPWRYPLMKHFYRQFIQPDDLCFDVGSHVGHRLWLWSGLQSRIIAIEPQPQLMGVLRRFYGQFPHITLVEKAVGETNSQAIMYVSQRNPTVNTLSSTWMQTVQQETSFAKTRWDATCQVEVVTLDFLIAQYGLPIFCKIDIEGYELAALRGLSQAIPALSFEFIPITMPQALACISRLNELGHYEYNYSLGETYRWQSPHWLSSQEMTAHLATLLPTSPSGDIYARWVR